MDSLKRVWDDAMLSHHGYTAEDIGKKPVLELSVESQEACAQILTEKEPE